MPEPVLPPIPFTLADPWEFPLHGLPLRCSVPLPEGAVKDPARGVIDDNDCTLVR